DLVICNRAESEALTGRSFRDARAAASALRRAGATEAAVTDGPREAAAATAEGVWGLTPEPDGGPRRATGAGDALAAAYLDLRLEGAPPEGALSAGIAAARAAREAR
ncbi:MAG: PfkB family carbohydrate kinase, partial [Paracoccaceae bacterium]